jgi:Protein RETICULATA-related
VLQQSRLAPLLRWRGFEERLLADPSFMVKVGIEVKHSLCIGKWSPVVCGRLAGCHSQVVVMRFTLPQVGIGICTKTAAEATKRGVNFPHELDFVAANIIMALVADFCLVWLPAPRANWRCTVPSQKDRALQYCGIPDLAPPVQLGVSRVSSVLRLCIVVAANSERRRCILQIRRGRPPAGTAEQPGVQLRAVVPWQLLSDGAAGHAAVQPAAARRGAGHQLRQAAGGGHNGLACRRRHHQWAGDAAAGGGPRVDAPQPAAEHPGHQPAVRHVHGRVVQPQVRNQPLLLGGSPVATTSASAWLPSLYAFTAHRYQIIAGVLEGTLLT